MKVASKVRSAILDAPALSTLSDQQSKLMKRFLEQPAAFLQETPEEEYYDKKAQAKASYSPQSATVTGILKDMYDTFAADLEKTNQDESNAQKGFEDVMAEKKKKVEVLQGMVTTKSAEKAEKSQQLAENEQLLEATQE